MAKKIITFARPSFFLINNLRVVVNAPNLIFVEDVDNPCLNKYIEKINNEHTLELLELCEETNRLTK